MVPISKSGESNKLDNYRGVCNQCIDSVYTDFAKAFDRVNHRVLIRRVSKLGFQDLTVQWLLSFLSERVQIVRIENYISTPFKVSSGAPQVTHYGPILFCCSPTT